MLAALCLALAPSATSEGGALHPEDGPDIDLRIAIDEEAVHVRMTMNIAFVWELVEFDWEKPPRFTAAEEAALAEKLFAYYRGVNATEIDGFDVAPVLAHFEVIELEHPEAERGPRGVLSTVGVRLELDYPVKSAPQVVRLHWGAYVPDFDNATSEEVPPKDVPCQLTELGIGKLHVFTQDEPAYTWRAPERSRDERFLEVPSGAHFERAPFPRWWLLGWCASTAALAVWARRGTRPKRRFLTTFPPYLVLSAVSAWAILPVDGGDREFDEDHALAVFAPLHANIYRAFDYSSESDVYDALARSVRGDLLDELYTEVYKSLVMQDQGGAVSSVRAVRPVALRMVQSEASAGFQVDARWQVDGSVFHWGHTHMRTNEYRSLYTVVAVDDGWRIAASETLEQFRVEREGETGEFEVTRESLEGTR